MVQVTEILILPILLGISFILYTLFLTLGTGILLFNETLRNTFYEESKEYVTRFSYEPLNEYLNIVVNVYIITVLLSTPLFMIYTVALFVFPFITVTQIAIMSILLSGLSLLYINSLLTWYTTDWKLWPDTYIQPYINSKNTDLSRKKRIFVYLWGNIYLVGLIYIYGFTIIPVGIYIFTLFSAM